MQGEVVLIVGGSGGIGRATAVRFAREGARPVLVGRDSGRLADAERASGEGAWSIRADLSVPADVERLAANLAEREGRLDILVNAAGQLRVGPASELGPAAAERLAGVNFLGAVRAVHACLPLLRRGRRRSIVNVSSIAARVSPPYMAAYVASKFALDGYIRSLRQELRPEGFHVGLVMPGPVRTAMVEGKLGTAFYPLPAGVRVASADEVAEAILRAVRTRSLEVYLPRRLWAAARMAGALPWLVDGFYRRYVVERVPEESGEAAEPTGE